MGEFLRNVLCFIGFHSWEWKTETTWLNDGESIVTDYGKCTNWRCKSHRWMVMNREKGTRLW